jgi:hypothetical protein
MGPIETQLRAWPSVDCTALESWLLSESVSPEAFEFVTWIRPKDHQNVADYAASGELPDVLSEAIEAAEALGL